MLFANEMLFRSRSQQKKILNKNIIFPEIYRGIQKNDKGEQSRMIYSEGNILRQKVKLCKAYNSDWNYKQIAEVIQITPNSFYNWLHGYYELSYNKQLELEELLSDLL